MDVSGQPAHASAPDLQFMHMAAPQSASQKKKAKKARQKARKHAKRLGAGATSVGPGASATSQTLEALGPGTSVAPCGEPPTPPCPRVESPLKATTRSLQ